MQDYASTKKSLGVVSKASWLEVAYYLSFQYGRFKMLLGPVIPIGFRMSIAPFRPRKTACNNFAEDDMISRLPSQVIMLHVPRHK